MTCVLQCLTTKPSHEPYHVWSVAHRRYSRPRLDVRHVMTTTLFADGFDDAIIGLNYSNGVHRVVYNAQHMVKQYMKDNNASLDDAMEYLQFNTFCAYMGEGTPLYVDVMDREEIDHYLENND